MSAKTDHTQLLRQSLYQLFLDFRGAFLFIGVAKNIQARKYKYEVYWYNSIEDSVPNISCCEQEEAFFDECTNSRMCEDLKEAHAYGFSAVEESLHLNSQTKVHILDLTK